VKIKAPFRIAFDAPFKFRVWGFGLGYLPMGFLKFCYNLRGSVHYLPIGIMWKANRSTGQPQISGKGIA